MKKYKTRLYQIWKGIKQRCYNPNRKEYKNYGARGIIMCKDWKNNYTKFYNWAISNGYNNRLTIERINNNGNYEPNNCKWITLSDQTQNKRNNIILSAFGTTKTCKSWSKDKRCVVEYTTIIKRLNRGWPTEEAIVTPKQSPSQHFITIFGETKNQKEWFKDPRCVVSRYIFLHRINNGWTPEQALTTPKNEHPPTVL